MVSAEATEMFGFMKFNDIWDYVIEIWRIYLPANFR